MSEKEFVNSVIQNRSCTVEQIDAGVLRCYTHGKGFTNMLFIVGMLLIYVSIVIIGWDLPQGRIHSSSLIVGSGVFLGGILCQWRCMRRKKELGVYEVNKASRQIQKVSTGVITSFDRIERVRFAVNPLRVDIRHLPHRSYWLFIHFAAGHRIRIAQGRRMELAPLLEWLQEAGIPSAE